MKLWCGIVSLFPDMFQSLYHGVTGRAIRENRVCLEHWNPRDYTKDKHQCVDDRPYGGGPGMVMMVEPLQLAIRAAKQKAPTKPTTICLTPQGRLFNQDAVEELASKESLIFIAGRYEGIDERVIEQEVDEEWSIGDYILTGGELPAMVMMDAIFRTIPEVVGDIASVAQDSITTGLLKYPQYTRPERYASLDVPDVLMSGHHHQIEQWRLKQSLGKTWLRRPDLLAKRQLTPEEADLLADYIEEFLRK